MTSTAPTVLTQQEVDDSTLTVRALAQVWDVDLTTIRVSCSPVRGNWIARGSCVAHGMAATGNDRAEALALLRAQACEIAESIDAVRALSALPEESALVAVERVVMELAIEGATPARCDELLQLAAVISATRG